MLIVLVALGVRIAFAVSQVRKISPSVLATVPFQTETGHIAYSIAVGKGYSSPYERDTGPTAYMPPVYPLLVAALFKIFGIYSRAAFFAAISLNILFSAAVCVPLFYTGKRIGGLAAACLAAWMWALFINAIIIPFEWIWDTSLAALLVTTMLWATLEVVESRRWSDWSAYGILWAPC